MSKLKNCISRVRLKLRLIWNLFMALIKSFEFILDSTYIMNMSSTYLV